MINKKIIVTGLAIVIIGSGVSYFVHKNDQQNIKYSDVELGKTTNTNTLNNSTGRHVLVIHKTGCQACQNAEKYLAYDVKKTDKKAIVLDIAHTNPETNYPQMMQALSTIKTNNQYMTPITAVITRSKKTDQWRVVKYHSGDNEHAAMKVLKSFSTGGN